MIKNLRLKSLPMLYSYIVVLIVVLLIALLLHDFLSFLRVKGVKSTIPIAVKYAEICRNFCLKY